MAAAQAGEILNGTPVKTSFLTDIKEPTSRDFIVEPKETVDEL
jgi:hypothetical protein